MPNGIPFSQMTTEHTRRLFEFVDSSEEEELRREERDNEWREIFDPSWRNLEPEDGKRYYEELKEKNKELKEENERLKQHIIHNYQDLHPNGDGIPHTEFFPGGRYAVAHDGTRTPYSALCGQIGEGIDELNQKATAWKIINRADWGYLRELCDKEMCKDLIECGECEEEDFEGYDIYEEEEE